MTSPVTLAEMKEHLRVTHDQDDQLITDYNNAAAEYIEVTTQRVLSSRAISTELACFPPLTMPIPLTFSPVESVDSITYYDLDGATQTMDLADVYLTDNEADLAWICLAPDASWPSTQTRCDAITIVYTAGYGGDASVPDSAKSAIKLMTAHLYDQRTPVAMGISSTAVQFSMESLVNSLRPGKYPNPD